MIIKFKCSNEFCDVQYEKESEDISHAERICWKCGSKLNIMIYTNEMTTCIEKQVKDNVDRWFKTEGIEGTIEMIERHSHDAVARLYEQELRRRGLKLKGD